MSAGAGVATANAPDASLAYRAAKRTFDIVFSLLVIVVGTVPGLLLALATVVSTGGSPLFVQERVGNKGAFPCIKMRTMRAGGGLELLSEAQRREFEERRKVADDPRVTPLGRLLRATSIDEFPQVFNVLAGQMSVVGPRAVTAEEIDKYMDAAQRAAYLSVPSGITGLWQTGERNAASWKNGRRLAIELDYVQRASAALDASIILKTFKTMFVVRSGR